MSTWRVSPKSLTIRTANGETDRAMKEKKKRSCIYIIYIIIYTFRKDKSREKPETKM